MRIPDVDTLLRDLMAAGRLLRRAPVFTLCAVLMLALAISATTAVFSIVNAALLRPLPHVDLDRWARLYEQPRSEGLGPMSASIPKTRPRACRKRRRPSAPPSAIAFRSEESQTNRGRN